MFTDVDGGAEGVGAGRRKTTESRRGPVSVISAHHESSDVVQAFLHLATGLPDSNLTLTLSACGVPAETIAIGDFSSVDCCSLKLGVVVRDDWQRSRNW